MARARLHLICGNCGCNDEWSFEYQPEEKFEDGELMEQEDVFISCGNCSTIHALTNNATTRPKK